MALIGILILGSAVLVDITLANREEWQKKTRAWDPQTTRLKCFSCAEVVTPEECEETTLCSLDEECLTKEIFVGEDILYKLGCKNRKVCDVLRAFHPPGTGTHGECETCCSTPYCNSHLCKKFDLEQKQCQIGSGLADPREAQEVLSCIPGQVCYSVKVHTDEEKIRYYLGCAAPKDCNNKTDILYYLNTEAYKVEDIICTGCCTESFCNPGLCTDGSLTNGR